MAREMTDEVRQEDRDTIYQKFITPDERRQRALLAGRMRGLHSVSAIAKVMGVNWTTANNILTRENVSVRSLYRLALALGVTISYLTERDSG